MRERLANCIFETMVKNSLLTSTETVTLTFAAIFEAKMIQSVIPVYHLCPQRNVRVSNIVFLYFYLSNDGNYVRR